MKKLTLQPYSLSGTLLVAHRLVESDRRVISALTGRPYSAEEVAAETINYPGFHWVATDGDTPHLAGGFIRQREDDDTGVYRTWFYSTPEAWGEYFISTTRIARRLIQGMLKSGGHAHRIETITLADQMKTREWYDRIGLTHEGTLRRYGAGGEDAVIYSAISGAR